jgi:hypothetical protein
MMFAFKLHLENKFRSTFREIHFNKNRQQEEEKSMTNKTRRTEITIETHEITIIRNGGRLDDVFCRYCRSKVAALRLPEIASLLQKDIGEIQDFIDGGEIHFIDASGDSLVCGSSLSIKNSILKIRGEK